MDLNSTIAAIATPIGRGGIGIVRLSGAHSLAILRKFVQFRADPLPRHSYFGHLLDAQGEIADEVLVTWFHAPNSYTGEDVAEISCHGSPIVLNLCLSQMIAAGARMAEPGEFTFRAYVHGRIDLLQAEAVRDLIDSTTLYQAKVAAQQKQGALSRRLAPVKRQLIDLIALLEAGIDFAEDDISIPPSSEILRRIDLLLHDVQKLVDSFVWGRLVREGFSLAIVGPPNAGKSSLFNALLGHERAIVTDIPGTTRDLVSENFEIGGIPVRLMDTAGIRESSEPIEQLGIARSFEAIADSTVTLVVIDAHSGLAGQDFEPSRFAGGSQLLVANKCDLPDAKIPPGHIAVSATTGEGLERLRDAILDLLSPGRQDLQTGFLTGLRHRNLLMESAAMLSKARESAVEGIPHEMLLLDLYCALESFDAVSGKTAADDILNHIFSTFCIGK